MYFIKGLNLSEEKRKQHLKELRNTIKDEEQYTMFCFLYENLSIIDGKSASLLQFNSILIAVIAMLRNINNIFQGALIVMFLFSSILCLYTVYIHWSTAEDFSDKEKHICTLLKVRDNRTIIYRISWWMSVTGLISLIAVLLFNILM